MDEEYGPRRRGKRKKEVERGIDSFQMKKKAKGKNE